MRGARRKDSRGLDDTFSTSSHSEDRHKSTVDVLGDDRPSVAARCSTGRCVCLIDDSPPAGPCRAISQESGALSALSDLRPPQRRDQHQRVELSSTEDTEDFLSVWRSPSFARGSTSMVVEKLREPSGSWSFVAAGGIVRRARRRFWVQSALQHGVLFVFDLLCRACPRTAWYLPRSGVSRTMHAPPWLGRHFPHTNACSILHEVRRIQSH